MLILLTLGGLGVQDVILERSLNQIQDWPRIAILEYRYCNKIMFKLHRG